MAIRTILRFPDGKLRQPTREVPTGPADAETRTLVQHMLETMYAASGRGLAAIQVGSDLRIFIVDGAVAGGGEQAPALVFCNPELTVLSDETDAGEEGCLSFPGIFVPVKRALRARCRALDLEGRPF